LIPRCSARRCQRQWSSSGMRKASVLPGPIPVVTNVGRGCGPGKPAAPKPAPGGGAAGTLVVTSRHALASSRRAGRNGSRTNGPRNTPCLGSATTLQLGTNIVVTQGERGAQEAGQRRPQVLNDQRRQHIGPLPARLLLTVAGTCRRSLARFGSPELNNRAVSRQHYSSAVEFGRSRAGRQSRVGPRSAAPRLFNQRDFCIRLLGWTSAESFVRCVFRLPV
jgi:hypothetical protein